MKYFNVNDQVVSGYDTKPKSKAQLDDGTIIEYDRCCIAGTDPGFGPKAYTKYLGRGIIYEVEGVKQYYTLSKPEIYDFWKVISE